MVSYPIHLKKQLKTCLMLLQIYLVFGPILSTIIHFTRRKCPDKWSIQNNNKPNE